jgi:hypothetical protein
MPQGVPPFVAVWVTWYVRLRWPLGPHVPLQLPHAAHVPTQFTGQPAVEHDWLATSPCS